MLQRDLHGWERIYPAGTPPRLSIPDGSLVDAFRDRVRERPDAPLIHFFRTTLSFADVDRLSGALAVGMSRLGIVAGDRVAIYTQTDPQFIIAQIAAWKLGASMVSVNPMLKSAELRYVLNDSGAAALVTLAELHRDVVVDVLADTPVRVVITSDVDDIHMLGEFLRSGALALADAPPGTTSFARLVGDHIGDDVADRPGDTSGGDLACLGYTSGTSGQPKGVITTHRAIMYSAEVYRHWAQIGPDDVFLCGAPLFHVTGLTAGVGLALLTGMSMVLPHRFDAETCIEQAHEWRCTFTVMAITAFRAMLDHPAMADHDLSRLTKAYSGGAPVSKEMSDRWQQATGFPIYNVYGLTETTGPSHAVPLGVTAPVDEDTRALSVGVPVPGADVRVVDPETLDEVPIGGSGEIWISGPMVTSGYWNKPDATRDSIVDGYLRTGDVGLRDADGWFFVVDRIKDMINAAGFKVSPREVEDVLGSHPAVREAAVVGVPDAYRGETVKAYVSVREGSAPTDSELISFCRDRLAAYKYPRLIEFVQELPKTASGKVLRRELRGD